MGRYKAQDAMEKNPLLVEPTGRTRRHVTRAELILATIVLFLLAKLYAPTWTGDETAPSIAEDESEYYTCHAPAPHLLTSHKIDHGAFAADIQWASSLLRGIVAGTNGYGDPADSSSLSVFLPSGEPIFEAGFGRLRANESSEDSPAVNGDSIYRMASITKMFTTAQLLLQKQQGLLSLDEDVSTILDDFEPADIGWATDGVEGKRIITTRQLLSHMSGLTRDRFRFDDGLDWSTLSAAVDGLVVQPTPASRAKMMEIMHKTPPVMQSYMTPVYSNLGYNVAGWVSAEIGGTPYEDLLARDIFSPLGMTSCSFNLTPSNIAHVVVPSSPNSEFADLDMKDENPSGGMYSSASDLRRFGQYLLAPSSSSSSGNFLTKQSIREWLRPLHIFSDNLLSIGLSWEIFTVPLGSRRRMSLYAKGGTLPSFHTLFGIDPDREFGLALLVSGEPSNSTAMGIRIAKRFAQTLDRERTKILAREYAGVYEDEENESVAELRVGDDGALALTRAVLGGIDLWESFNLGAGEGGVVALWPTHEPTVWRLAIGRPPAQPFSGCMFKFASMDGIYVNGYPLDMLILEGGKMVFKVANATLTRS